MKPRLCSAGIELRAFVDKHYPNRDKRSDGWLGDLAHASRKSDHNPDLMGIVRAIDIDRDLRAARPDEMARLVETFKADAAAGRRPIAYIIYNGKICSPKSKWAWRVYDGANPHLHHAHISFRKVKGE